MSAETPQSTGTSYQIKVIGARPTPPCPRPARCAPAAAGADRGHLPTAC